MTDKQIIQNMLKVRQSTPKVKLSIGQILDKNDKDYGKTFLYMLTPISKKLYQKLNLGNHNTSHTYRTD